MNNQLFSSGSEVANLAVSSGLLELAWCKIEDTYGGINQNEQQNVGFSLSWKFYEEAKSTIIVFVTSPVCTRSHLQDAELVSSEDLKETFPFFEYLCSNGNSSSIHRAAITLFASHINELLQLKNRCRSSSNPLIITGHSLGGSIASLFTLWLLENFDVSAAKRPLCLTFGSPLVGDKGFQEAISDHPVCTSCFLHVAASEDPIPRLFITHSLDNTELISQSNTYRPFGTFLLCCEMGYTCSDNPEAVSELLAAMSLRGAWNEEQLIAGYHSTVEQLESLILSKGISQFSDFMLNSLRTGTILQLEAIGLQKKQHQNVDLDLIWKLERLEETCLWNKRNVIDPARKLNDIKIGMAQLEWYKKVSKDVQVGYYDCYKNQCSRQDIDVNKYKNFLTKYWKDFIAEAEKSPQKRRVYFRRRWLYAGATYRRMVEPLDIAEYYSSSDQKNYLANGRSGHYIKLEQWLAEAEKQGKIDLTKQNVDAILTYDSCFWAHVEEARICCKLLVDANADAMKKKSARQNLMKFEQYVMEQIMKSEVSSEIFLKNSSFMLWWKEYEKIIGANYHNSPLADFMKNCKYHQYANGCLVLY